MWRPQGDGMSLGSDSSEGSSMFGNSRDFLSNSIKRSLVIMFKVENLRQNRTAFLKWNNCIRFILGLLYSLDIFDLFFVVGLVISIENHRFFP